MVNNDLFRQKYNLIVKWLHGTTATILWVLLLAFSKMLWQEEVEVAGGQFVLSGFGPDSFFQALGEFQCSYSSGQS